MPVRPGGTYVQVTRHLIEVGTDFASKVPAGGWHVPITKENVAVAHALAEVIERAIPRVDEQLDVVARHLDDTGSFRIGFHDELPIRLALGDGAHALTLGLELGHTGSRDVARAARYLSSLEKDISYIVGRGTLPGNGAAMYDLPLVLRDTLAGIRQGIAELTPFEGSTITSVGAGVDEAEQAAAVAARIRTAIGA